MPSKSSSLNQPALPHDERLATPRGREIPEVVSDLAELPPGSHCLSFYASDEEAADQAAAFLAGAEDPRSATYWVADGKLLAYTRKRVRARAPAMTSRVKVLGGPQAVRTGAHFRPTVEVVRFVSEHPEGVTAAGQTITRYWTRETIPGHVEYEQWFHQQPRRNCRFLCPYDLRRVPADLAGKVLPMLAQNHSHMALSKVPDPASLILQLSVSPRLADVPKELEGILNWSLTQGFTKLDKDRSAVSMALEGEQFAKALRAFPGDHYEGSAVALS